jgi:hypothetical protein
VLTGWEQLKIITTLEDSTVCCGDVEEERYDIFLVLVVTSLAAHLDLICPALNDMSWLMVEDANNSRSKDNAGDLVFNHIRQVCLVHNRQNVISTLDSKRCEASVLDYEYVVLQIVARLINMLSPSDFANTYLWVGHNCRLVL